MQHYKRLIRKLHNLLAGASETASIEVAMKRMVQELGYSPSFLPVLSSIFRSSRNYSIYEKVLSLAALYYNINKSGTMDYQCIITGVYGTGRDYFLELLPLNVYVLLGTVLKSSIDKIRAINYLYLNNSMLFDTSIQDPTYLIGLQYTFTGRVFGNNLYIYGVSLTNYQKRWNTKLLNSYTLMKPRPFEDIFTTVFNALLSGSKVLAVRLLKGARNDSD